MSLRYRDSSGNETIVSGLTPGGDIEAGAMAERSGTFNISVNAGSYAYYTITFDEPMPDDDYIVSFYGPATSQGMQYLFFNSDKQTANGFVAMVNNTYNSAISRTGIRYKAVKTYSVQHAAQNAEDIANILSVIPSDATSANKLTTQSDLENVEIDVDDALSASSTNPVQNKVVKAAIDAKQDKVFVGTVAEWEALSAAEQSKYQLVNLTDDGETINDIFVIVHAGVNEVVTIDNTHSITMNSKGEAITSLSPGMHTLTGSMSEKTFEVIVNGNTTDIYCMPNNGEGILYWFGAELTPLMFNRDTYGANLTRDTNRLVISKYASTSNNNSMLTPTYKINLNNYSKINTIIQYGDTTSYYQHLGYGPIDMSNVWPNSTQIIPSTTKQEASYNFASGVGEQYCGYETNGHPNGTYIYALWLDPR